LIFGVLGLIFAFIGVNGNVKISLVLVNILGVSLSIFLGIIAMFGFQQA
jgi:hypothetical protein